MRLALPSILAVCSLLLAVPASAASLRPWISVNGSSARYSMGDVNRVFDEFNAELNGTGLTLWHIDSGFGVGASAGADLGPLSVGFGLDRLFASSGIDGNDVYLKFRAPANGMRATAEYTFPHAGALAAHVGAAGGIVSVTGSLAEGALGDVAVASVRGHGPLWEGSLGLDWLAQPRCALSLSLGYRRARVDEIEIGGEVTRNPDGSRLALDYSGVFCRVGARLPLLRGADSSAASAFSAVRPWVAADGSWGVYAMGDAPRQLANGPIEQKRSGMGFGGMAGLDFPARVSLGFGYDRVGASSDLGSGADALELHQPANAFYGVAQVRFTVRGIPARAGLGAGALFLAGSTDVPGRSQALKLTGSGALIEARLSADVWRASRFAVTAAIGYRHAKVSEVKADELVLYQEDGSRYSADYSGAQVRLGLRASLAR